MSLVSVWHQIHFLIERKIWNWKICEFGVFALFKPNQISKLIHVLNYGWHLKTLFLELKKFSRLWVKTERLEQEIKNFDLFWNQLVQYIIIENLKGMKFFVTFWISDHATLAGNGYNMKYILYYMQIIIQIRRQNTIDMMHIWIRIGLVDSESAHSQTIISKCKFWLINHSIVRLFYPDQPIFFNF